MKKVIFLSFLVLFCICMFEAEARTTATNTTEACQYSTEGTEFRFGFLTNRTTNTHYLQITVTSQTDATVTLTYGTGETLIGTYSISANTPYAITIDSYSLLEPSSSESAENKGIHLVSDNPVNVYAYNYDTRSSDVAVIFPVVSLGSEYYAICYTPHSNNSDTDDPRSELLVVATETGTTVTITTSAATAGGHAANASFSVSLEPGQVYQVRSVSGASGDLTGSHIIADKPIAFYSGCSATSVPTTGSTVDHLYEQIPPLTTWGREFYAVPLTGRTKDTYRILASEDNTVVTIGTTGTTQTLSKGGYYEFTLSSSQACKITSTKKVLMAQYCRSQTVDSSSDIGDPLMIIISPVSQKINDVTFTAYKSSLIDYYYINLVTLTSETGLITLDGSSISSKFTAFSGTKYSYAQIGVGSGSHRLISYSTSTNGGFLASVYGFGSSGSTESYRYGVGFSLNLQLDLAEGMDVDDSGVLTICEGDSIELDAGSYFDGYQWFFRSSESSSLDVIGGETSSTLTVSQAGEYCVEATSSTLGCTESSCITIKTEKPEIEIIATATVACTESELTASPTTYSGYVWQDGSTSQTYTVETTGDYSVTVTDSNGCKNMAETHVDIILPKVSFTVDYTVATFAHPDITFTNLTESTDVTYYWDFGDGSYSTEVSPTHHYSVTGTTTGTTYTVTLTATSELVSGCTDSYEMTIQLVPLSFNIPNAFRPSSDITINQIFQPIIVNLDENNYRFRVFNRNGSVVFETTDYATGWDGTFSGDNAGVGVYVWIVEYVDVQGYSYRQKGTVMLLR
jgi:hypothetical protein